jgi:hypothetical protein
MFVRALFNNYIIYNLFGGKYEIKNNFMVIRNINFPYFNFKPRDAF